MGSRRTKRFTGTRGLRALTRGCLFSSLALVAGCTAVGPDYHAPEVKAPAAWHAALPHGGNTVSLLNWWRGFDDPVLDSLLRSAEADHPTLAQAAASIAQARAGRQQAAAGALPVVQAGAAVTRSGSVNEDHAVANTVNGVPGQGVASTTSSAGLDASWEIDLFGSVRRRQEAADARLQASEADWHEARVSLAAEVASEYVRYRACRLLAESQRNNFESLRKTANSTTVGAENGLIPRAELALASAGVSNASATFRAQEAECELGLKALVALTGEAEASLRQKLESFKGPIPSAPTLNLTSVPVQLLSQRPDLLAAERRLAAASADIGVAEANRYPRFSLLGSVTIGRTEAMGSHVSTSPWSFGPSLSLPLLDGGSLRAQVASARAGYDIALANYKGAVRNAVMEVEQSMVRLDAASRRLDDVASSARDYRRYFESAQANWQAGAISLLTLEESRRSALQAEQNDIATRRDRVLNGIALYKALGGGWHTSDNMNSTGVSNEP